MKSNLNKKNGESVTLEGIITLGKLENGLRSADFMCCQEAMVESLCGPCKVQIMHDGNMYITEIPKRRRNKAIFRDDNATLSQGRNGRWYFCFSMDEDELELLPGELVRQAGTIARKVNNVLIPNQQAV